ncbi:hypothetical protein C8F01DRAFT_1084534 [Mycena amicta]|nr:hypothetical protein C8F01DRAFT_1084534 [Mycena amicta]
MLQPLANALKLNQSGAELARQAPMTCTSRVCSESAPSASPQGSQAFASHPQQHPRAPQRAKTKLAKHSVRQGQTGSGSREADEYAARSTHPVLLSLCACPLASPSSKPEARQYDSGSLGRQLEATASSPQANVKATRLRSCADSANHPLFLHSLFKPNIPKHANNSKPAMSTVVARSSVICSRTTTNTGGPLRIDSQAGDGERAIIAGSVKIFGWSVQCRSRYFPFVTNKSCRTNIAPSGWHTSCNCHPQLEPRTMLREFLLLNLNWVTSATVWTRAASGREASLGDRRSEACPY